MFVVVTLCGTESDVCGCYAVWNWKVMFVVVMLCGTESDVCGCYAVWN